MRYLLALISLCFLIAYFQANHSEESAKPELQLVLSTDRAELLVDDKNRVQPIVFKLRIRNISKRPITLCVVDVLNNRLRGDVKAMPADSITLERYKEGRVPILVDADDFPKIEAGKAWSYPGKILFPGPIPEGMNIFCRYSIVKAGELRVTFTYAVPKELAKELGKNVWSGQLVSNALTLKVRPLRKESSK